MTAIPTSLPAHVPTSMTQGPPGAAPAAPPRHRASLSPERHDAFMLDCMVGARDRAQHITAEAHKQRHRPDMGLPKVCGARKDANDGLPTLFVEARAAGERFGLDAVPSKYIEVHYVSRSEWARKLVAHREAIQRRQQERSLDPVQVQGGFFSRTVRRFCAWLQRLWHTHTTTVGYLSDAEGALGKIYVVHDNMWRRPVGSTHRAMAQAMVQALQVCSFERFYQNLSKIADDRISDTRQSAQRFACYTAWAQAHREMVLAHMAERGVPHLRAPSRRALQALHIGREDAATRLRRAFAEASPDKAKRWCRALFDFSEPTRLAFQSGGQVTLENPAEHPDWLNKLEHAELMEKLSEANPNPKPQVV